MVAVYSELLVKLCAPEAKGDIAVYVGNVVNGTQRMRELLTDLLTYAELGAQEEQPRAPVSLDAVIETVRNNLALTIQDTRAVITADALPVLLMQESHLLTLFQNLIGNAIKYRGSEPPRVHISLGREARQLVFTVVDNGIGIAPEYHEKIFMAFKRLHGKKIPGTGIGLAICKRVVERYGGQIWVESSPGAGSKFLVRLPDSLLWVSPGAEVKTHE